MPLFPSKSRPKIFVDVKLDIGSRLLAARCFYDRRTSVHKDISAGRKVRVLILSNSKQRSCEANTGLLNIPTQTDPIIEGTDVVPVRQSSRNKSVPSKFDDYVLF